MLWDALGPFYNDEKFGAMKTAAIARYRVSPPTLSSSLRTKRKNPPCVGGGQGVRQHVGLAAENRREKGSLSWLNFHLEPWEADDSQFYGATLAAIAVAALRTTIARRQKFSLACNCSANTCGAATRRSR